MNGEKELSALKNLVRVGKISSIDVPNNTARVALADKQDTEGRPLISGPLKVVDYASPSLKVGQFVLCLYLANGESDGFVIGGI